MSSFSGARFTPRGQYYARRFQPKFRDDGSGRYGMRSYAGSRRSDLGYRRYAFIRDFLRRSGNRRLGPPNQVAAFLANQGYFIYRGSLVKPRDMGGLARVSTGGMRSELDEDVILDQIDHVLHGVPGHASMHGMIGHDVPRGQPFLEQQFDNDLDQAEDETLALQDANRHFGGDEGD